MTENFSAYSIFDHRHVPEVLLTSGLEEREFTFTAQLLPIVDAAEPPLRVLLGRPLDDIRAVYEERLRTWSEWPRSPEA